MSFLQKTFKLFSLVAITILAFSSVATATQEYDFASTSSNVGIVPANPGKSPITRAWFIEKIKAGESVEREALLVNSSDTDLPVIVVAKDSIQTPQGSFTFKENADQDTLVGTWVEFVDNPKLVIPAKTSVKFKFKVNVPSDVQAGEYAGVLAVQQDKSGEERNGVQILMRMGARIYITVDGELNINTETNVFEFLTDSNEQYKLFLARNMTANYETVYLNIGLANKSNIFTKVAGTAKIIDPDGQEFTQPFNRELASGSSVDPSWVNMQQTWKVGKYKAIYEWENSPVVDINKENLNDLTQTKKVEIDFEMTADKLEAMSKLQAEANAEKTLPTGSGEVVTEKPILVETAAKVEEKSKEDNTLLYAIIGGLGVVVLAMGGVFGFFTYKNSKKEEESDTKVKTKSKKGKTTK